MSEETSESQASPEAKVKVSDRRRFDAGGEARSPSEVDEKKDEPAAPSVSQSGTTGSSEPHVSPAQDSPPADHEFSAQQGQPALPPASFELLVISIAMQAQIELGAGEPSTEQVPDLDMARHSIDLLAILQQKTKGNLTVEEQRLLDNTVTELRFRYVQAVNRINEKAKE